MFSWPLNIILIGMITIPLLGKFANKRVQKKVPGIYAALILLIATYFMYRLYIEVTQFGAVIIITPQTPNLSFSAILRIDMIGVFLAFLHLLIGLLSVVYSTKFMENDPGVTLYYSLTLGMIAGMIGTVFAGDFLTLYVFWELMCLTSYTLVAFRKQKWASVEAGFKYLVMSVAGSVTILLSMSLLYGMTGTLNFMALGASLTQASSSTIWSYVTLVLVIVGFGIKAAIVPFHTWLPDAHSAAPSPISALLSGVMVQTGAVVLLRVLMIVFGSMQPSWQMMLTFFAILTMFGGNLMALLQDDLKRLLAYSTIAQTGYIIFGFSTVSYQGLTGGFFHILNHAIIKSLLFLCAGGFIYRTGTRNLRELQGIKQTMPLTSIITSIGAVAISAIPPLNGFWSEVMIVSAGIEVGMLTFSILMVLNMLLSVAYYLRIIYLIVLKKPTLLSEKAFDIPVTMLFPILIPALLCLIIGMFPGPFIGLAQQAAQTLVSP